MTPKRWTNESDKNYTGWLYRLGRYVRRHTSAAESDQRLPHWTRDLVRVLIVVAPAVISLILLSCFIAAALQKAGPSVRTPLRSMTMRGDWIAPPGEPTHAGFFRKPIHIPGNVRHAWVAIASQGGFEVTVNRNTHGRWFYMRPTRPFQTGMGEPGQRLTRVQSAMELNFPREYQWDGHDHWRTPVFVDITSSMRTGRNVIAVEVESRTKPAAFAMHGEVTLWSGKVIPIRSGVDWRSEPTPPDVQIKRWENLNYNASHWRNAITVQPPAAALQQRMGWTLSRGLSRLLGNQVRSVPVDIYSEPFRGVWMQHPTSPAKHSVTFETTIDVGGKPLEQIDEASLRVISNRRFHLEVNGKRFDPKGNSDADAGDWIFESTERGVGAGDAFTTPELLDPDEVGNLYVGKKFESPRYADERFEEFIPLAPMDYTPFRYERTYNRSEIPGEFDPLQTRSDVRRTTDPETIPIDRSVPSAVKRDQSDGGYFGYSIGPALRRGINTIRLHLIGDEEKNWTPQIGIDGRIRLRDGTVTDFPTDWYAKRVANGSSDSDIKRSTSYTAAVPVKPAGAVHLPGKKLPPLQYRGVMPAEGLDELLPRRGNAIAASDHPVLWCLVNAAVVFAIAMLLAMLEAMIVVAVWGRMLIAGSTPTNPRDRRRAATAARWLRRRHSVLRHWSVLCRCIMAAAMPACITIATGLLVRSCFIERHELLLFDGGFGWRLMFTFSALAAVLGIFVTRIDLKRIVPGNPQTWLDRLQQLPYTRTWWFFIAWVLILAGFLRGFHLDLQPLDDDEYASTQAIMAILETGAPAFAAEDVYYTRSPAYHYITAAIAWPFGGNLWTLRLQSAAWGVATCWLVYLCGSRLMGERWVGWAAMLLVAIHPLEVFTGHTIRFYQMQQFLALLTVYLFCRGFVDRPEESHQLSTLALTSQHGKPCWRMFRSQQTYRIATLVVFLLAVLSQEITAAMGLPLILGYLLFAKDLGWRNNIQLAVLSGLALLIIFVDFMAFKTLCQTRTEGVSPNIESAVRPHFWHPMNYLALLVGYSRLHMVASGFMALGLPFMLQQRCRNTIAFFAFMVMGIVMTNILVTHISLRYQYWVLPIWILICLQALRAIVQRFSSLILHLDRPERWSQHWMAGVRRRPVAGSGMLCAAIAVLGMVLSFSPWRMPGSYEMQILGDSTGCVAKVRSAMRPGDRIAITEPHTHAALMEAGQVDFDIAVPLLFDFVVKENGKLVDRNGGATVLANVDQLDDTLAEGGRLWLLVNREKFRSRGANLRWEYPAARFELFLRRNCQLRFRTYLWSAYLWDPAAGQYAHFRRADQS